MKLGFVLEPDAPNSNYRVILPMRALERLGHDVVWPAELTQDVSLGALASCDLVHCFRRLGRLTDLRGLSRRGVAISFDNDDDLSATDISLIGDRIESSAKGRLQNQRKFMDILKAVRLADLATTPSRVLADRYRSAGASHVAVIENHLDPESMGVLGPGPRHDGIIVGWMAGKEHQVDVPHLPVINALEDLLARHREVRVVSLGVRLPLHSTRYEHRKGVPFGGLLEAMRDVDIGIAPLTDTAFNWARSNVKLKEYGSVGAAWLASPVGAYAEMGNREGGLLVENSDWSLTLEHLVRGGFKRRRLARQALKWASSQTIDHFASTWEQEFMLAIERARERTGQSRSA